MDYATKASLDLVENARSGKKQGSLFWLLDETKTAMGMRLLRSWIHRPLIDKERIIQTSRSGAGLFSTISLSVVI